MQRNPSKQTTEIAALRILSPKEVLGDNPPITASYGSQSCPVLSEGQPFTVKGAWPIKPESFCEAAWAAMKPYVMAIHCGGDFIKMMNKPGVVVVSRPDGFKPVVFKIERMTPED